MKKHCSLLLVLISLLSSLFAGLEETLDFSGVKLPSFADNRNSDRFYKIGCGFFVTRNGFVVTGKHLIAEAKTLIVVYDNKAYEAEKVPVDEKCEFAVLRVSGCENIQPVMFSQTGTCKSGDKCLLAANSASNEHGIIPGVMRGVISDVSKKTCCLYVPTASEHAGAPMGNLNGYVEGMLLETGKRGQNFNQALRSPSILYALPLQVKRGLVMEANRNDDSNAAMQRLSRGVVTVLVYNSEVREKSIRREGRDGSEIKKEGGKLQYKDLLKLTKRAKEKKAHFSGSGSGFFITEDGYFVTNHHVIDSAEEILLVHGDKSYPARIAAKNKEKDLALLKVEGVFKTLAIAGSNSCEVGQNIFTVGFPKIGLQGLSTKVTKGIISSLTGFRDEESQAQIDAPIQSGNSGGPVVNEKGAVVGVAVATLRASQNVNYMIKADELLAFLPHGVKSAIKNANDNNAGDVNVIKNVVDCAALVACYANGSGSEISDVASRDDRKRLERGIRRMLRAARMAKLNDNWNQVERITDEVLSYDSSNDEAKAMNDQAKTHLGKHLMIRALVNENEVRGRVIAVSGIKNASNYCEEPIELFDKDKKTGFVVIAKIVHDLDGVKYEGTFETVYNWSGMKEVTVRLTRK